MTWAAHCQHVEDAWMMQWRRADAAAAGRSIIRAYAAASTYGCRLLEGCHFRLMMTNTRPGHCRRRPRRGPSCCEPPRLLVAAPASAVAAAGQHRQHAQRPKQKAPPPPPQEAVKSSPCLSAASLRVPPLYPQCSRLNSAAAAAVVVVVVEKLLCSEVFAERRAALLDQQ